MMDDRNRSCSIFCLLQFLLKNIHEGQKIAVIKRYSQQLVSNFMKSIVHRSLLLFVLSAVVSVASGDNTSTVLPALRAVEDLYHNSTTTERRGNVDIISNDGIAVCNVFEMNRHTDIFDGVRTPFPLPFPQQVLAAVALAADHLNSGNGSIIPELEGLNETCNIRFVAEFIDTVGDAGTAVKTLRGILDRERFRPCAFIGAFMSTVSIPTSILTGVEGYPQISALSTSPDLDDKSRFPLFGRVVPTAENYGKPLLDFLYNQWGIEHLGVFHSTWDVGLAYLAGLQAAVTESFPQVQLHPVSYNLDRFGAPDLQDLMIRIKLLKDTGVRFFFLIGATSDHKPIFLEAQRQGIMGTGIHNWILSDTFYAAEQEFLPSSPKLSAATGVSVFKVVQSREGVGGYTPFRDAWQAIGSSEQDLSYLREKIPRFKNSSGFSTAMDASMFQDMYAYVPLFYDAMAMIGLAACSLNTTDFTGSEHFQAILDTHFVGASGPVALNPETGTRLVEKVMFRFANFVPVRLANGNVTLSPRVVATYQEAVWSMQEDAYFNDNTTTIPLDLPPQQISYNRIGGSLRVVGYVLFAVVLSTSMVMAAWTWSNQKTRVIKASQPLFLHLVCFGRFIRRRWYCAAHLLNLCA